MILSDTIKLYEYSREMSDEERATEKLINLCKNPSQPGVATVELLDAISKGANLNILVDIHNNTGDSKVTPLLLACENNANLEFIKILLEKGADPNIASTYYNKTIWTPLSWLGHNRNNPEYYKILFLLINSDKLDPNFKDNDGYTYLYDLFPLKASVLEFIKKHGRMLRPDIINATCFENNNTILLECCREYWRQDNIHIIKALLEIGADPNIAGDDEDTKKAWTPLAIVAHQSGISPNYRDDIIMLLINSGRLNPNTRDPNEYSYLFDLSNYPHLLSEFLIKNRGYIDRAILDDMVYGDDTDSSLLMLYCYKLTALYNEILKAQEKSIVSARVQGRGALRFSDEESKKVMNQVAANAEAAKKIWETSIVTASLYRTIIQTLVTSGASLNIIDKKNHTALDYLRMAFPQVVPTEINDVLQICYDIDHFLSSHGAMTSEMIKIRSTPIIKRSEFSEGGKRKRKSRKQKGKKRRMYTKKRKGGLQKKLNAPYCK
jgi:hypothetical protein